MTSHDVLLSMENPVEKLEALQLSVTAGNSISVEMSESAEDLVLTEISQLVRETGETSGSAGSAEAASPVKIAESFQTVQEKVDSWKSDADGLTLGLFRLDPPKPMGTHSIDSFEFVCISLSYTLWLMFFPFLLTFYVVTIISVSFK